MVHEYLPSLVCVDITTTGAAAYNMGEGNVPYKHLFNTCLVFSRLYLKKVICSA